VFDTPALRRRYLERQSILQEELAAELARREGLDAGTDLGRPWSRAWPSQPSTSRSPPGAGTTGSGTSAR